MNLSNQFISNFNPDGECTLVAMDYIYSYFHGKQDSEEKIRRIKRIKDILDYLNENGLNFLLAYSPLSILSPFFWEIYVKYKENMISHKQYLYKKKDIITKKKKYIVLIEENAKMLYGLKFERWTHFVILQFNNGIVSLYDPLKPILEKEYTFDLNDYSQLSEEQMENSALLKILIYK